MKSKIFKFFLRKGFLKKTWIKLKIETYKKVINELQMEISNEDHGNPTGHVYLCFHMPRYYPYLHNTGYEEVAELKPIGANCRHPWFKNNRERLVFVEKCLELAKSKL